MKEILKKIIPIFIFSIYFYCLEYFYALLFGFPARNMIVIGVTGTKGKSTVAHMIGHILEQAGYKVGWTSSVDFKIDNELIKNTTKMTMPGRVLMQNLLSRMRNKGCQFAVIETSSEGLAQYRHVGIDYDVAVFTNLSPEHIERHGGFENYKKAKLMLFKTLEKNYKKIIQGRIIKKISIVNLASEQAQDFLQFSADQKVGYAINDQKKFLPTDFFATDSHVDINGMEFILNTIYGESIKINSILGGEFNIENMLAAAATTRSLGIDINTIGRALNDFTGVAGRLEKITAPNGVTIFIDYAHEPKSLASIFKYCRSLVPNSSGKKLIGVFGSAGGGRDTWKRPVMGEIAAYYCDNIVLTNDDPYDEDPEKIINEIEAGFNQSSESWSKFLDVTFKSQDINKKLNTSYWKIIDRTEAIKKALALASNGDIVVLAGKGSDNCIMGPKNTKMPWNEREVVENVLNNYIK